ncbi:unnamed protein product [Aphanomyces euteiches]
MKSNMAKSPSGQNLPRVHRPGGKISLSQESEGFHWWPLPIALSIVFAIFYMGNILYDSGWLDKLTGGLVSTQFHEENILVGGCAAINHALTWRELSRKSAHCSRESYFDPLHNTCAGCIPFTGDDKFMAVTWDPNTNCSKLVEESETRYISHVYWTGATIDATGAVVPPKDVQDNTPLSKCMTQLRTRCIRQIGVIGDFSAKDNIFAKLDSSNIATFAASAASYVKSRNLDGLNIADPSANSGTTPWPRAQTTIDYMMALRKALDDAVKTNEPRYTLSWDEYASAFIQANATISVTGCKGANSRCFSQSMAPLVDTIQLQMNTRPSNVNVSSITGTNWTAIIPRLNEKIMYAYCNAPGCSFTAAEVTSIAFDGTYKAKGAAIYSGTVDVVTNKAKMLTTIGEMGAYGVLMPMQLVDMPIPLY